MAGSALPVPLSVAPPRISDAVAEQQRFSPTLYLRSGTNAIALHVDEMVGSNLEIVVKAIGPQLQRVAGITGATVLGTGEIVLILNPVQLALKEVAARRRSSTKRPSRRPRPRSPRSWWSTIRSRCAKSPEGCWSATAISW